MVREEGVGRGTSGGRVEGERKLGREVYTFGSYVSHWLPFMRVTMCSCSVPESADALLSGQVQ